MEALFAPENQSTKTFLFREGILPTEARATSRLSFSVEKFAQIIFAQTGLAFSMAEEN